MTHPLPKTGQPGGPPLRPDVPPPPPGVGANPNPPEYLALQSPDLPRRPVAVTVGEPVVVTPFDPERTTDDVEADGDQTVTPVQPVPVLVPR